jgi:hypothetical protein
LGKILTSADAEVTVRISPGGITTEIRSRDGTLIGSADDLQKLAATRTFVTQERRAAATESLDEELLVLVHYLQLEILKEDKDWKPPTSYSNEFLGLIRQSAKVITTLGENFEKLSKLEVKTKSEIASSTVLCRIATKLIEAEMLLLKTFLKDGKLEKGFKNRNLLSLGIPRWFSNRLTLRMDVNPDSDINRILFPQTARSWIHLSVTELRDPTVINNIAEITGYSLFLIKCLRDDVFLRKFCGIPADTSLADLTAPSINALFNAKVHLIPHCLGLEYCLEPSSKNRSQNLSTSPRFANPADAIETFSESFLCMASGNPRGSDILGSFWSKIFPSIKIDRSKITASQNVAKSILDLKTDEIEKIWTKFFRLESLEGVKTFFKFASNQMLLVEGSRQYECLETTFFGKNVVTSPVENQGEDQTSSDKGSYSTKTLINLVKKLSQIPSSEAEKGHLNDLRKGFPKKKAPDRANQTARCILSLVGRKICSRVRRLTNGEILSKKLEIYLRSFTDVRIQQAAVSWLEAQFDEIFIAEISDTSEETEDSSSLYDGEEEE